MTTIRFPLRRSVLTSLQACTASALLALAMPVSFAAVPAKPAAPANTGPKTHVLFMGADYAVQQDNVVHPVRDVVGDELVIEVKGETVRVPTRRGPLNLKVQQSLKVTNRSASIGELKSERVYTPAADPNRKFASAAGNATAAGAVLGRASGGVVQAEFVASAASQSAAGSGSMAEAEAGVNSAYAGVGAASFSAGSDFNNVGEFARQRQEELAKKLFDAIEISFEVSSEKPLIHPYVVVTAQYREKDVTTGPAKSWLYAKSLNSISRDPRKVQILQGGFPPGFELAEVQLHLYNDGEEVATNVSPKRVALTREEALEYRRIEYLQRNKGATLPAVPIMGTLPPDLSQRLARGEIHPMYYVKVSREGRALDVFLDEACAEKANDAYVEAFIREIRFNPALSQGKPIEAVASLNLTRLSL